MTILSQVRYRREQGAADAKIIVEVTTVRLAGDEGTTA